TVYAKVDRTYVATPRGLAPQPGSREAFRGPAPRIQRLDTPVAGDMPSVASADVAGLLLSQFAMDEHAAPLPVASPSAPAWSAGCAACASPRRSGRSDSWARSATWSLSVKPTRSM